MCLGNKKNAAQDAVSTAPTASTSNLIASGTLPKPESFDALSFTMLAGYFIVDTQAHGIYEKFLTADDDI